MSKPKVSVVVPSYNRAEYIAATITSILSQSFSDLELIFIDDGSTDNTEEIVQVYAKDDLRLKYFKQVNSERAVARSFGMSLAIGDYVCLVDSDDIWYPHKLEKQVEVMEQDPDLVCCYASVNRIDLSGMPVKTAARQHQGFSGEIYQDLLKRNFIPSVTPMIRAKYIKMAGDQRTEFIPYEDWDFWLRLARLGRFQHIREPLGAYRLHPCQSVQNVKAERIEEVTFKVLDSQKAQARSWGLEEKASSPEPSASSFDEAYSLAHLRCAYWYIISGDLKVARDSLRKSPDANSKRAYDYRWWGLYFMSFAKKLMPGLVDNLLGSFH